MIGIKSEVMGASKLYVDYLEIMYISSTNNEIRKDFLIYPNPIIGGNSFTVRGIKSSDVSTINIYGLDGKKIEFISALIDQESVLFTIKEGIKRSYNC